MPDRRRMLRVVTTDETLIASVRAATAELEGWEVEALESFERLLGEPAGLDPGPGARSDVILLDAWHRGPNVYEVCRRLAGRTRARTFVVVEHANLIAEPIARFCGATGVLHRPLAPSALREALATCGGTARSGEERRGDPRGAPAFPEDLLVDVSGRRDDSLVGALVDPETSLFNYPFLNYKLDEEYKRAMRFGHPLSCVMLGFEGEAGPEALGRLAGIFLETSRDTDVLGRFDQSSFLFLLPHTGPDGAAVMAQRVSELAEEVGLVDLVGDRIVLSAGIATCPHPEVRRREDLYARAREAFFAARREGGGVVAAS